MKIENFVLNIIKKIESLSDNVIAYGYNTGNDVNTYNWWEICISDFDLYTSERFRKLSNAWHTVVKKRGEKIVFVCKKAEEKELVRLLEENNLILNTN